ncbi:formin-2-like [Homarus americanus]|uniref:formin-2-like n=1 Tax=Homarus americanus TaxID=6706 RepID=UPI001C47BF9E|nr:formin-2-like [Homarus americanus]
MDVCNRALGVSQGSPPSLGEFIGPRLDTVLGSQSSLGVSMGTPLLPLGSWKTPASLGRFLGLLLHLGESQGSSPPLGGTQWLPLDPGMVPWVPGATVDPVRVPGTPSILGGCLGPSMPLSGYSPHLGRSYVSPPALRGSLGAPAATGVPAFFGRVPGARAFLETVPGAPVAPGSFHGAPPLQGGSQTTPASLGGFLGLLLHLEESQGSPPPLGGTQWLPLHPEMVPWVPVHQSNLSKELMDVCNRAPGNAAPEVSQGSPPSLGEFLGPMPPLRLSQGPQSPLGVSMGTPPLQGGYQTTPASLGGFLGLLLHLGELQGSQPPLGGSQWPPLAPGMVPWALGAPVDPGRVPGAPVASRRVLGALDAPEWVLIAPGFLGPALPLRPSQGPQLPLEVSMGTPPFLGGSQKTPASLGGFLRLLLYLGVSQGSLPPLGGTHWPPLAPVMVPWVPGAPVDPGSVPGAPVASGRVLGSLDAPESVLTAPGWVLWASSAPVRIPGVPAAPGRVTGAPPIVGGSKEPHCIWEGFRGPNRFHKDPRGPTTSGSVPAGHGKVPGGSCFSAI